MSDLVSLEDVQKAIDESMKQYFGVTNTALSRRRIERTVRSVLERMSLPAKKLFLIENITLDGDKINVIVMLTDEGVRLLGQRVKEDKE